MIVACISCLLVVYSVVADVAVAAAGAAEIDEDCLEIKSEGKNSYYLVGFQHSNLNHCFAVAVVVVAVDFVNGYYAIVCSTHSHSSLANSVGAFVVVAAAAAAVAVVVVVDEYCADVVAVEVVYSYLGY